MDQDKRCAPGKNYSKGSCFTIDNLVEISKAYNSNFDDKITIKEDKRYLLQKLNNKLKNVCNNQQCWLKLKFMKDINDKNLLKNTFRPKGPDTGIDWLSTSDINNVMKQYEQKYDDFQFLGAVPLDFMKLSFLNINNLDFHKQIKKNKKRLGMVINLDEHDRAGSHWVGLFTDLIKKKLYFFDSYGHKPDKQIKTFMKKVAKYFDKDIDLSEGSINKTENDIRYNKIRHQYKGSECGVYSMNFIIRLLRGEDFMTISKSKVIDDEINKCRASYFTSKK
jgi:hypothetical protein